MNRFPKMMILWKVYFEEKGEDERVAMALGHAVATAFAIAKNIRRVGKRSGSKGQTASQNRIDMREGWEWYEIPYIPQKGVWLKPSKEGWIYILGGKTKNGTAEYIKQVRNKFDSEEQYEKYEAFAHEIVEALGDQWKRKWFKTWQKVRDLDWDKVSIAFAGILPTEQ